MAQCIAHRGVARRSHVSLAFDEGLAERVREAIADHSDVREKKMFGGRGSMLRGNMGCGIVGDRLMVRVGADAHEETLKLPHAHPFAFTGQPVRGMVYVDAEGIDDDTEIATWLARGLAFAALPPE